MRRACFDFGFGCGFFFFWRDFGCGLVLVMVGWLCFQQRTDNITSRNSHKNNERIVTMCGQPSQVFLVVFC